MTARDLKEPQREAYESTGHGSLWDSMGWPLRILTVVGLVVWFAPAVALAVRLALGTAP